MERKTRNSLIIYSIAALILAGITWSVWHDLQDVSPAPGVSGTAPSSPRVTRKTPIRHAGAGRTAADPASSLRVSLHMEREKVAAAELPELAVELRNTSSAPLFVSLDSVVLRKYDYVQTGKNIPVVCKTSEVIPWRMRAESGAADALCIKPGRARTLRYDLTEYFDVFPGVFDIEWAVERGGVTGATGRSGRKVAGVKRVTVTEGVSAARFFMEKRGLAPDVAARVNGEPLYEHEFLDALRARYGYTLLQQLIAEKLVWQELKKRGVKVSREDLDYAVAFEKRLFEEKMKGVPFEKYLETKGLTEKKLRESRGFILRVAIRKYMADRIPPPSREDLLAYFDRRYSWYGREEMVSARKLVVVPREDKNGTVSPYSREEALRKLLAIREEIVKGKISFADAVRLYSQDVRARVSGGLMDPFRRYSTVRDNDVPKAVADVGFRLKPGEVSGPIETKEGFMILQVVRRIPPRKVFFRDVAEKVKKDYLYEGVRGEDMQKWIKTLFDAGKVEISARLLKQFAQRGRPKKLKHYEVDLVTEEE